MFIREKITNNPDETMDYACSILSYFQPSNIYGLKGEMASGKTTFIKGLMEAMNYKEMVNSPTFTLINEYNAKFKVIHIDCYREKDVNRWVDIGVLEYFNSNSIVLIEWPEVIKEILPNDTKYIEFKNLGNDRRRIRMS